MNERTNGDRQSTNALVVEKMDEYFVLLPYVVINDLMEKLQTDACMYEWMDR